MINGNKLQGIIFDYGGTLDTNGVHWSEVFWNKYRELNVNIGKDAFKEAYVYGERTLAVQPLIRPEHDFYDVLCIKIELQISYLRKKGMLRITDITADSYTEQIARSCYNFVLNVLICSRDVLKTLAEQYKLALVSNFYGNIHEILKDFGLLCFFKEIIESSVVGVRKPDPAIFALGIRALGGEKANPERYVVIGDSFSKDMVPAKKLGCKTVWLKGKGWSEETDEALPDEIILSLSELPFLLSKK